MRWLLVFALLNVCSWSLAHWNCNTEKCIHFEMPSQLTWPEGTEVDLGFPLLTDKPVKNVMLFIRKRSRPSQQFSDGMCTVEVRDGQCYSKNCVSVTSTRVEYNFTVHLDRSYAGLWTWRASIGGQKVSCSSCLNVTYLPRIETLSLEGGRGNQTNEVAVGEMVDVVCKWMDGNPPFSASLFNSRHTRVTSGLAGSTLRHTILNVSSDDNGTWTCQVEEADDYIHQKIVVTVLNPDVPQAQTPLPAKLKRGEGTDDPSNRSDKRPESTPYTPTHTFQQNLNVSIIINFLLVSVLIIFCLVAIFFCIRNGRQFMRNSLHKVYTNRRLSHEEQQQRQHQQHQQQQQQQQQQHQQANKEVRLGGRQPSNHKLALPLTMYPETSTNVYDVINDRCIPVRHCVPDPPLLGARPPYPHPGQSVSAAGSSSPGAKLSCHREERSRCGERAILTRVDISNPGAKRSIPRPMPQRSVARPSAFGSKPAISGAKPTLPCRKPHAPDTKPPVFGSKPIIPHPEYVYDDQTADLGTHKLVPASGLFASDPNSFARGAKASTVDAGPSSVVAMPSTLDAGASSLGTTVSTFCARSSTRGAKPPISGRRQPLPRYKPHMLGAKPSISGAKPAIPDAKPSTPRAKSSIFGAQATDGPASTPGTRRIIAREAPHTWNAAEEGNEEGGKREEKEENAPKPCYPRSDYLTPIPAMEDLFYQHSWIGASPLVARQMSPAKFKATQRSNGIRSVRK